MKRIGCYLRVSTTDQSTDLQRRDIQALLDSRGWGECVVWYEDVGCTGTNGNRAELRRLLSDARSGQLDLVIAWKLDRLFRSLKDLITTLQEFGERGVEFISIKDAIDLSTSAGRLMMHMLGAFAEFEASLIRERTKAGMASARKRGARIGRRPKDIDVAAVLELRQAGATIRAIAAQLGVSRSLIHRLVSKGCVSRDEAA